MGNGSERTFGGGRLLQARDTCVLCDGLEMRKKQRRRCHFCYSRGGRIVPRIGLGYHRRKERSRTVRKSFETRPGVGHFASASSSVEIVQDVFQQSGTGTEGAQDDHHGYSAALTSGRVLIG